MADGMMASRDYVELHDTSKAVSSRREAVFGSDAEIFTFVNPSRVRGRANAR